MVIICTVLGAAAPSLRGFFVSRQTNNVADRILALTRLARSQAVSEGCTYRLEFETDGRVFFLSAAGPGGFQPIESSLGRRFTAPAEVSITLSIDDGRAGTDYIDFFPDGRTQPATIRVQDIEGGVVEIVCRTPAELFAVRDTEDEP